MNLYSIYLNENIRIKRSKNFLIGNKYIRVLLIQTIYKDKLFINRFKVILDIGNTHKDIYETINDDKQSYKDAISVYKRINKNYLDKYR